MVEKRLQGRPSRGENEVGRAKIVEMLQDLLRRGNHRDVSRKQLAEQVGVTPALITYYFPARDELLLQATEPVVASYLSKIRSTLVSDLDQRVKLWELIQILIYCFKTESGIFAAYWDLRSRMTDQFAPDLLADMHNEIVDFLNRYFIQDSADLLGEPFPRGALWGLCQIAAHASPVERSRNSMAEDVILTLATPIYNLFVNQVLPIGRLDASALSGA